MLPVILALNPSQLVQTWLLIVVLLFFITFIYASTQESIQGVDDSSLQSKKQNITLTALLEDQGDPTRWRSLIEPAMQKLMERHPDLDIEFNYTISPYNVTHSKSALDFRIYSSL
jgi:multiple sugar transport system substrate-binding protein